MKRFHLTFQALLLAGLLFPASGHADFSDAIDSAVHDIQKAADDIGKSKTQKFIESPAGMALIGAGILVIGVGIGVLMKKRKG